MPKDYKFTNVVLDAETRRRLDLMAAKSERSKSKFVKLLINQEWERGENDETQEIDFEIVDSKKLAALIVGKCVR